jgi:drug/metabolite transporter (DMT)-like permease
MHSSMSEKSAFSRFKGVSMAFGGAALWGLSGTVAQVLIQDAGVQPGWLVTVRLLCAGALLIWFTRLRQGVHAVWSIWRNPTDRRQLTVFGLLGMLGVQYTFFAAIEAGNAATATLLQFLGPVFITLYLAIRFGRLPNAREWMALSLAMVGTFLLVTDGSVQELSISPAAVGWGLGAALTAAFYTVYPAELLKKWGAMPVVGWGMFIGGIGLSFVNPPWSIQLELLTAVNLVYIVFVVLFGTLIPFYLVLESLRYISPAEAGMLNSAEPLAAVIVSVLWLHVSFGLFEALGGACIIATVMLLASNQRNQQLNQLSHEAKENSVDS